jgi:predicted transcriptional regulator
MPLQQGEDGDRELYNSLFRSLKKPQRRRLLFNLLEHNPQEPLSLPEGVHVGEMELATLNLTLRHHDLPMMEGAGLIRWDREADEVHKGPKFAHVRELLEAIKAHDPIIG